jgi:hypothetical protein
VRQAQYDQQARRNVARYIAAVYRLFDQVFSPPFMHAFARRRLAVGDGHLGEITVDPERFAKSLRQLELDADRLAPELRAAAQQLGLPLLVAKAWWWNTADPWQDCPSEFVRVCEPFTVAILTQVRRLGLQNRLLETRGLDTTTLGSGKVHTLLDPGRWPYAGSPSLQAVIEAARDVRQGDLARADVVNHAVEFEDLLERYGSRPW